MDSLRDLRRLSKSQGKSELLSVARTRTRSRTTRRSGASGASRGRSGGGSFGLTRNLGMLSLALWLILAGLNALTGFTFPGIGSLMAFFALAAGLLLLLRR